MKAVIREQLDAYVKEKYGIDPEILPFSKEDYAIYRHSDTGKWFAVFIVKERHVFGLSGQGEAEIVSFKIRDRMLADHVARQPGYLRGYPARSWNWTSAVLDGTIPFEDICRWVDESYAATKNKGKNKRTPLRQSCSNRKRTTVSRNAESADRGDVTGTEEEKR